MPQKIMKEIVKRAFLLEQEINNNRDKYTLSYDSDYDEDQFDLFLDEWSNLCNSVLGQPPFEVYAMGFNLDWKKSSGDLRQTYPDATALLKGLIGSYKADFVGINTSVNAKGIKFIEVSAYHHDSAYTGVPTRIEIYNANEFSGEIQNTVGEISEKKGGDEILEALHILPHRVDNRNPIPAHLRKGFDKEEYKDIPIDTIGTFPSLKNGKNYICYRWKSPEGHWIYNAIQEDSNEPIIHTGYGSPEYIFNIKGVYTYVHDAMKKRRGNNVFGENADVENPQLFSVDNVTEVCQQLKDGIKAPAVGVSHSTLGGKDRVTILMSVSLDKREDWKNQIFENSRYFRLSLERNGRLQLFVKSGIPIKLRSSVCNSIEMCIAKINKYINEINSLMPDKTVSESKTLNEESAETRLKFFKTPNGAKVFWDGKPVASLLKMGNGHLDGYKVELTQDNILDGEWVETLSDAKKMLATYFHTKETAEMQ